MAESELVRNLAIWGAITGTIGSVSGVISLLLRYRLLRRDNPSLRCAADFSFENSAGEARPKHKIIVRSVGRRPVSVDFVRYYMRPQGRTHRLFKWYYWSKKRWVYDQPLRNPINLHEGQKENIFISVPNGFILHEVLKTEVHDQAGNTWKVQWPAISRLRRLVRNEQLDEKQEENGRQQCKVVGYLAGDYYHIYVHWNREPGNKGTLTGQLLRFENHKEYDASWEEIVNVRVPKFLNEEITAIQ